MAIACYATGSTVAYNYLRGEFHHEPFEHLEEATAEAYENGWLGKNMLGQRHRHRHLQRARRRRLHLRRRNRADGVAGRQEGPAALQAAVPGQLRPVRQADHDQQHRDLRLGAGDHPQRRRVVPQPGQAEQRRPEDLLGVRPRRQARATTRSAWARSFADLLEMAGGMRNGRKLKARDPGRFVDAGAAGRDDDGPARWTTTRIQKAGSGLGSGAVIVMDETTCMVRACQRIARFYYKESCGQCTPCREGTGWMYRMLTRIVERQGDARGPADAARPPPARSKATPSARSAKPPRGRCRASCATTGTSSNTRSSTSASWSTTSAPARGRRSVAA